MIPSILWINNSPNPCGGTLRCTIDMCHALPDFEHTVLCRATGFSEEAKNEFPLGTKFIDRGSIREELLKGSYAVVVFQNTNAADIPNALPRDIRTVYYAHSAHGSVKQAMERCERSFVVSKWLADKIGVGYEKVLYQPVAIPKKLDERPDDGLYVIGRICTPSHEKWDYEDVSEPLSQIYKNGGLNDLVRFEFVGCPQSTRSRLTCEFGAFAEKFEFFDASTLARSRMHNWDVLLMKTSIEESFGRCVKEAQRCGCYPIVSSVAGFREQIDDEYDNGYLVGQHNDWGISVTNFISNGFKDAIKKHTKLLAEKQCGLKQWRLQFLKRII